jgi:catalase
MMDDHDHPELDWDPLDDTKVWPENDFPVKPSGAWCSTARPGNFFAESEQIAFGTGVLVDGLDFSDDKMLVGRTFSYSDTQRYRVGPNYLQLPVNQRKNAECARTSATGRWPTTRTRPARTRPSTTSRRSRAACARRSTRRTTTRARSSRAA